MKGGDNMSIKFNRKIILSVLLIIFISVLVLPFVFVRSVSYAGYSTNCVVPPGTPQSPICNGAACDCYVPYAGRGGHIWVGVPSYGQFIQQCWTTWRSGCCDFC